MTFERFWAILQKQWKLILICFFIVGSGTYIVSKFMTPVYQSSVLVQVTLRSATNQADYNSLLASDQLVQTEAQLAVSNLVLQEVASHYHGLTADTLSRQVTSTTKLNTQLFEIDVQNSNATQAATLANDIATVLIKQQLQVTQQDNARSQQQIQQDLDTTRQQIDSVTTQITALQNQAGKQSQVTLLQAQLSGLQQHYSQWQTALAQLELTEAQSSNFLRIAQPAQPPPTPIRPQVFVNTMGGLAAGLCLGVLLALLFEQLDTRVRTTEALTAFLDKPILATIRLVNASKGGEIVNPSGNDANVEAYRILRTNIGFSGLDTPLRSLIVTSAIPHEGKSVVAANLAIFLAKAGKNTLLIDADLRRPTLHKKFGISMDKMGLSNAVMAFAQQQFQTTLSPTSHLGFSLDSYMHSVGIPNLRIMPSGPLPPNPPELLDSKAMERFCLAIANCGAEMIIFDTPPLLGLSDTSILAAKADGMLTVVDITRASKGHLNQLQNILTQTGANVIGYVVNKESKNRKDTGYSYYYYRTEEQGTEGSQFPNNGHMSSVPTTPVIPMTPMPPNRMQAN